MSRNTSRPAAEHDRSEWERRRTAYVAYHSATAAIGPHIQFDGTATYSPASQAHGEDYIYIVPGWSGPAGDLLVPWTTSGGVVFTLGDEGNAIGIPAELGASPPSDSPVLTHTSASVGRPGPEWAISAASPEIGGVVRIAKGSDHRSVLHAELITLHRRCKDREREPANDGVRVSSIEAIKDAMAFLELLPLRSTLPRMGVASDGEIDFYWKSQLGFIDVGFFGDGMISYYAHNSVDGDTAEDAEPFSRTSIPPSLLRIIQKM